MFANPQYTRKTAPVFTDSARYATEGESLYVTGLRPAIMNDEDSPPKALIELDMFLIPMEDFKDGTSWRDNSYDLSASICMTPIDTIRLVRHLNHLLSEIFKDHNYIDRVKREPLYEEDPACGTGREKPIKRKSKKAKVMKAKVKRQK